MSVLQFVFLLILIKSSRCQDIEMNMDEDLDQYMAEELNHSGPEPIDGKSFFFLGTLFRRWRNRWMAYHNPDPMFAGPAYPIAGYYNCPAYGCNPAVIGPQPGYYATPAGFYTMPLSQGQQAQGNSNVYIYQSDQNSASAASPLGVGYGYGYSPATPLPLPPPGMTPPPTMGTASATATGYSGPGAGPGPGQRPGPYPIPLPQLG